MIRNSPIFSRIGVRPVRATGTRCLLDELRRDAVGDVQTAFGESKTTFIGPYQPEAFQMR